MVGLAAKVIQTLEWIPKRLHNFPLRKLLRVKRLAFLAGVRYVFLS